MKYLVAITLVVVALSAAEPPRLRTFLRQSSSPYNPRGWRPQNAAFSLPARSQRQDSYEPQDPQQSYGPPEPHPSYGPPPAPSYGPPPEEETTTTTEQPTTTAEATTEVEPEIENIRIDPRNQQRSQAKPANLEQSTGRLFLLLPQRDNLLFSVQPVGVTQNSARLQIVPVPFAQQQQQQQQQQAEAVSQNLARLQVVQEPFAQQQQQQQQQQAEAVSQNLARLQVVQVPIAQLQQQQGSTLNKQNSQLKIMAPSRLQQLPVSSAAVFTPYSGSLVKLFQ